MIPIKMELEAANVNPLIKNNCGEIFLLSKSELFNNVNDKDIK